MNTAPSSEDDKPQEHYDDLLREGMIYAEQGFYLKAIELFEFTLENDKPNEETYLKIAKCYLALDENDLAQEALHKAYKLNDEHFEVVYWLGFVYFLQAEYHKAIKYFDQAIELNPDRDAYYYKAIALMREEEIDEALETLNIILENDPADHFALYQKGLLYFHHKEKDIGIKLLQQAKELGNQDAEEYLILLHK